MPGRSGKNRVPAAHVSDVVRLYPLALEKGQAGGRALQRHPTYVRHRWSWPWPPERRP